MITLCNVIEIETSTEVEYIFVCDLLRKLNIEWSETAGRVIVINADIANYPL